MPSRRPSSSWTSSSSFVSGSSSLGGPKKSPVHSNKSNFPCLASIALTFANNSRIEPTVEPTVNLLEQNTRQDSVWDKILASHFCRRCCHPSNNRRTLFAACLAASLHNYCALQPPFHLSLIHQPSGITRMMLGLVYRQIRPC